MANIKIFLDSDETEDEAKEQLLKAFSAQANGDTHTEDFQQALPRAVVQLLQRAHQQTLQKIYKEIQAVVGKDLIP